MDVCLISDFILCDWYRLHSVNCLCGMLRCKWSRLLLKSKVLWWWSKHGLCGVALCNVYLACFTPGMNQKRETDLREDMRFFLVRSGVSAWTGWRVWLMWMLLIITCWKARRLVISVSADASGRLTGQAYAPKGGETQCSGILIHIGGPALSLLGSLELWSWDMVG